MNAANDLDMATGQRASGAFFTLAAQFALLGYALIKGDSAIDGQALYYAMRMGAVQPLEDLEAAALYLGALMGAGDGEG